MSLNLSRNDLIELVESASERSVLSSRYVVRRNSGTYSTSVETFANQKVVYIGTTEILVSSAMWRDVTDGSFDYAGMLFDSASSQQTIKLSVNNLAILPALLITKLDAPSGIVMNYFYATTSVKIDLDIFTNQSYGFNAVTGGSWAVIFKGLACTLK